MSINHLYSSSDFPAHEWWSPSISPNTSSSISSSNHKAFTCFNLNNNYEDHHHDNTEEEERCEIPKVPLFEKPLTPSDVGKLNRLVVPKQHAERHFNGPSSDQKGLMLSFEDEVGRQTWRFRYSYWSSSQSYVLTKGWSRFVREKRLQAGDIVVFSRHREDHDRLFIGWRKTNHSNKISVYRRAVLEIQNQKTATRGNSKILRLFGVNLEANDESEASTPLGSPMSSQGRTRHNPYHHQFCSNHHTHMDMI